MSYKYSSVHNKVTLVLDQFEICFLGIPWWSSG